MQDRWKQRAAKTSQTIQNIQIPRIFVMEDRKPAEEIKARIAQARQWFKQQPTNKSYFQKSNSDRSSSPDASPGKESLKIWHSLGRLLTNDCPERKERTSRSEVTDWSFVAEMFASVLWREDSSIVFQHGSWRRRRSLVDPLVSLGLLCLGLQLLNNNSKNFKNLTIGRLLNCAPSHRS